MSAREDFIWIRAKAGFGEIVFVHGNLVVRVSEARPQEVTRGEWNTILEPMGMFEIGEAPKEKERSRK